MRFVLHVSFPTDKFNESVQDGTAGEKLGRILEDIKPEAAYFTTQDGKRGGVLIVEMKDPSEIPKQEIFAPPGNVALILFVDSAIGAVRMIVKCAVQPLVSVTTISYVPAGIPFKSSVT